jgi:4-amino-4-deoxy-L-arabinose transferase-like glycosyltransferase
MSTLPRNRKPRAPRLHWYLRFWLLLPLIFAAILLTHWTLLRLPYFWDEGGYYVPAALDFFRTGTLIPQSTVTNAHPPLPMVVMAGWWKVFGFHLLATRVLVCLVAAFALLGVFRLARTFTNTSAAAATTLLTALYPIWFAQSTLAHADIFAAAFTLWGLAAYFAAPAGPHHHSRFQAVILFSLAALSKETAIVTPLALAVLEAFLCLRERRAQRAPHPVAHSSRPCRGEWVSHAKWAACLAAPVVPLAAWYAYHRYKTGFIFGNPEFLRYNATANLTAYRILLCLYHRVIHLTLHMNLFVPVLCAIAALFMPAIAGRRRLARPALIAIAVVLAANTFEFSVLGGALLTRYLLPMYPLVLLLCVAEWQRRLRPWGWLAAFSAAAFVAGIFINPPYAFAPEDNLTYRDMIVLHQQAIAILQAHYPEATVLTAWPAAAEISRPELGYTTRPFKFVALENFSLAQMQKAAADPGAYDTALLFSTKWAPARGAPNLHPPSEDDAKYFDFHLDLRPREAASLLHGEVVWQASRGGEWAALLRFPRIIDARLTQIQP